MDKPGGVIEVGAPADITVFDIDYQWTVDRNMFHSKSRNTPFHGFHVLKELFSILLPTERLFITESFNECSKNKGLLFF